MLTSLMFLVLLGIVTCDILCLGTADECKNVQATSIFASANLLKSAIKKADTIIYSASDIPEANKLENDQIKFISEIIGIKSTGPISVKYEISAALTISSLSLTKVSLTVAAPAASGGGATKLKAGEKLTCTSLILNDGSSLAAGAVVSIEKLTSSSLKDATVAIPLTTNTITIAGVDALITIEASTDTVKLTGGQTGDSAVDILNTIKAVNINSSVTTEAVDFTVKGDFTTLKYPIDVNLIYGNNGKTITTLKSETGSKPSEKLKINVQTYYKVDDSFTPVKDVATPNESYKITDPSTRIVPASSAYCLDKNYKRMSYCPKDAQILWDVKEFVKISNGKEMITVHVGGFTTKETAGNIGHIKDMKNLNLELLGENQQFIKIDFDKANESIVGDFMFENIELFAEVPTGTSAASLSCNKIFVEKSKIEAEIKTASSKKLFDAPKIEVKSVDLTSDSKSLKDFDLQKATKSFSIIDLTKAEFVGDGKTVKFDDLGPFSSENILVPFTINVAKNVSASSPLQLIVSKDTDKGTSTALPFSIDVQSGAELNVKYEGDWSSNKVVVNVAKGGKFIGKTEGADSKEPNMELQGEGTATINGKDVPRPVAPAAPTDSNNLSGGAIAGIVIACIVVVAAVVVGVFIVLKKKKGKVAN